MKRPEFMTGFLVLILAGTVSNSSYSMDRNYHREARDSYAGGNNASYNDRRGRKRAVASSSSKRWIFGSTDHDHARCFPMPPRANIKEYQYR